MIVRTTLALMILLAVPIASADDLPTTCQQLLAEKSLIHSNHVSLIKLLFKMAFDRGSFVNPNIADPAPAPSDEPSELTQIDSPIDTMTIYTLGRLRDYTKEDKAVLKAVQKESQRQLKALTAMLKASTADECVAIAQKEKWTPDELDKLTQMQQSALQPSRHEESQASWKAAESIRKGHPQWTIVDVDSWGEIIQHERANPSAGMMVILHADPTGRLYDSQRDELPSDFFKGLPDGVRFVGVYSCESDAVIKAYSLAGLSSVREIVAVRLEAPFAAAASTPIQFFPNWVKKLEKSKLLEVSGPAPAPEKECDFLMKGMTLKTGRVSVTWNGLPVGVLSSENENGVELIPCSWVEGSSPASVMIEPSQIGLAVSFESNTFSAFVQDGNASIPISNQQFFTTPTGDFRSSILSR